MVNNQLLDYIKQQLAQGLNKETIQQNLTSAGGWNVSDITEAFSSFNNEDIPRRKSLFKKWWFWVIVVVIIAPIAVVALFIFELNSFFSGHYVSYADESTIINQAVSKNDPSICSKLPSEMYGDSISDPAQVCVDEVNYAKDINEGARGCLNLSGRQQFDCLVQVAFNTNDPAICQQISSNKELAGQICPSGACSGASLAGECVTELTSVCKQNAQDFQGCRADTSDHDY